MQVINIQELLTVVSVSVPVIVGLTSIAKSFVNKRFIPLISLFIGLLVGYLLTGFSFSATTIIIGIISGLTASGLYSQGKTLIKG